MNKNATCLCMLTDDSLLGPWLTGTAGSASGANCHKTQGQSCSCQVPTLVWGWLLWGPVGWAFSISTKGNPLFLAPDLHDLFLAKSSKG